MILLLKEGREGLWTYISKDFRPRTGTDGKKNIRPERRSFHKAQKPGRSVKINKKPVRIGRVFKNFSNQRAAVRKKFPRT